jgi:general secretion pathway protein G
LRKALIVLRTALDAYKRAADEDRINKSPSDSGYPADLRTLVDGVTDKKSLNGEKIYFLRKLPADPMCECPGTVAEETWESRAYDSSAENFSSGKDVFDIRSTSSKEGINGIPYQDW